MLTVLHRNPEQLQKYQDQRPGKSSKCTDNHADPRKGDVRFSEIPEQVKIIDDKKGCETEDGIDDEYPDIFQEIKQDRNDDDRDDDKNKQIIGIHLVQL